MRNTAQELFAQGFNCSQAVFGARAEELRLTKETAFQVASGFGAGMGRKQETCGAVTGAGMVLGMKFGHTSAEDKVGKEQVYARVLALHDRFAAVHGSTNCRQLLGCDLTTPEGQKAMKDHDLMNTVCLECVGTAHDLVTEILKENP